jgi:hypothetical protein
VGRFGDGADFFSNGGAMPFPDPEDVAALKASWAKFEEQISALQPALQTDTQSRRQCRTAANELMALLQALVNRLRD